MNAEKMLLEIETVKGKKQAKIPKLKKKATAAPANIIRELYTPGCIGHGKAVVPDIGGGGTHMVVQDFLVDSSGLSKGGESVNPIIQVGLNMATKMIFSIAPEACKRIFKVAKPAGVTKGYFGISFGRAALHPSSGGPDVYDAYPATITFNGLAGTAPVITYAYFFISKAVNNYYYVYITGEFTNNFAFTDIQIKCSYPARTFKPPFDFYKLLSYSVPFTLPGVADANYALFSYTSPTGTDLGPIITLI